VGPLAVYAIAVWFIGGGGEGREPLSTGLSWSAGALVPVVAWLTRSVLTAEPSEARACIAAAGGPHRAHLAALIAALAGGLVLGLGGAAYELATCQLPKGGAAKDAGTIVTGLAAVAICIGVGSAIGAFCHPPVVRAVAVATLATTGAVIVVALVTSISPANAAIRDAGSQPHSVAWPVGLLLIAALLLVVVSWAVSTLLAARRGI
jgi:hypothetical protein